MYIYVYAHLLSNFEYFYTGHVFSCVPIENILILSHSKTSVYCIVCNRDYAAIVFIANNRFEIGKKKLHYLQFRDFAACATHMITKWSYSSVGKCEMKPVVLQLCW